MVFSESFLLVFLNRLEAKLNIVEFCLWLFRAYLAEFIQLCIWLAGLRGKSSGSEDIIDYFLSKIWMDWNSNFNLCRDTNNIFQSQYDGLCYDMLDQSKT